MATTFKTAAPEAMNAALPLTAEAAASYTGIFASAVATTDVDTISQTTGNDTLIISATSQLQAEDSFDGSDGTDTIIIGGTVDLRGVNFNSYEALSFNGSGLGVVHTDGTQYGSDPSQLPTALTVYGSAGSDTIVVHDASSFSAANWTLNNWTAGSDALWVYGTAGGDYIGGSNGRDILIGGDGSDYYVVNATTDIVVEHANEGTDTVVSSATYVLSDAIENLALTGTLAINGTGNSENNTIYGNTAINTLTGLGGNDTLDGGVGADKMLGGLGDDTYYVDNVKDAITEVAGVGSGVDTVNSSVMFRLGVNVENLNLTGSLNISGTGNALANVINGNSGANRIDGLGGADTMVGGAGDDTYVVDNALDTVTEGADAGKDVVISAVTFELGDNLENLVLSGTKVVNGLGINGYGNELENKITGNAVANTLYGYEGNDTIDGGKGIDHMYGGSGDDTYFVDVAGDVVNEGNDELDAGGTDTVNSLATFTLGANIENLTLIGSAAVSGTGNGLNNILIGNSGANSVYGLGGDDVINGGKGVDHLYGGDGDDTYFVDVAGDLIGELEDEGTDTVNATVTYTLSNNIENLVLVGGAGAINGTGNGLANHITGNASVNILTGGGGDDVLDGGLSGDTMKGGTGDDTYYVDAINDLVVENPGEGTDSVYANVNTTLSLNIENLTLTGSGSVNGIGNLSANHLTGNDSANNLFGMAGDDTISGGGGNDQIKGGAGQDVLTGGDGNDTFVYELVADSAVGASDTIMDFTSGDKIDVQAIDAKSTASGNQTFVADDDGTYVAGEYHITNISEGLWQVDFYTDAVSGADMSISVHAASLSEADFVL